MSYRELDSIGSIARFLLEKMKETPSAVLQLVAIKAARAWYGTDSGVLDKWLLLFQIPVVAGLFVGVVKTWRRKSTREAGALIALTVLYFWLITTAALSIVRYMVPALALMVVTLPALGQRSRAWMMSRRDGPGDA